MICVTDNLSTIMHNDGMSGVAVCETWKDDTVLERRRRAYTKAPVKSPCGGATPESNDGPTREELREVLEIFTNGCER